MQRPSRHISLAPLSVVILVPLFFLLHEWNERFPVMRFTDFIRLLGVYVAVAAIIYTLTFFVTRDTRKTFWLSVVTIFILLFFGTLQDAAGGIRASWAYPKNFFPAVAIVYLAVIIAIYRSRRRRVSPLALLALLAIYLVIELSDLYRNYHFKAAATEINTVHPPAKKTDIYLLVYDEYASTKALAKYWSYDNRSFDSFLVKNGFRVMSDCRSNYNSTVFSIPSVFRMDFLPVHYRGTVMEKKTAYLTAPRFIFNAPVTAFLEREGYAVYNYSFFNLRNHPLLVPPAKLPFGYRSVYEQTLPGRVEQTIDDHTDHRPWEEKNFYSVYRENNAKMNAVAQLALSGSSQPKFVFMHVLAPHAPFYNDSNGALRKPREVYRDLSAGGYTAYLSSCNKSIEKLVTSLNTASKGEAVIIVMGDHGYRDTTITSPGNEHQYMNLLAIKINGAETRLPQVNSLVNLFPAVLNGIFGTNIRQRPDSTVR